VPAVSAQSSAAGVLSSATRKLDLGLLGGLTRAAMCPLVDSTKRTLPPSSWLLR
jgi:hypothetical protein